jgi:hypothetical protein
MNSELIKYITVFAWSMVKFIFGPVLSALFNISFVPAVLLTIGGMMTSVIIFTFAGRVIRHWWMQKFQGKRVLFTPKKRRMVRIWRKYGIWGVATLTPLLFTPIGGTMIAVSFGEKKHKILFAMLVSAIFWAVVFCSLIVLLGKEVFLHLTGH